MLLLSCEILTVGFMCNACVNLQVEHKTRQSAVASKRSEAAAQARKDKEQMRQLIEIERKNYDVLLQQEKKIAGQNARRQQATASPPQGSQNYQQRKSPSQNVVRSLYLLFLGCLGKTLACLYCYYVKHNF
jgi:hypothetical protein